MFVANFTFIAISPELMLMFFYCVLCKCSCMFIYFYILYIFFVLYFVFFVFPSTFSV